jgi:hypothetical protein
MKFFEKSAGWTQHGGMNERARAMALAELADEYYEADRAYPGMSYVKGTVVRPYVTELLARKEAYKAQLQGAANLKRAVPFIGYGPAGRRALGELRAGD